MTHDILTEAWEMINKSRREEYGDARICMEMIAQQWSMYLLQKGQCDAVLTAEDVCWMMADLKKVRQIIKKKRDNLVDAAGYIGLIEKVQ